MELINRMASTAGEPQPLTGTQMAERLFDHGVIAKREAGRYTTRVMVAGERSRVWQVSPDGIEAVMTRSGHFRPLSYDGCLCHLLMTGPCERDCPEFCDV
jgi:hypothetical protein